MLTYSRIAELIEPVAEKTPSTMTIGSVTIFPEGWDGATCTRFTQAEAADLACAELVRRLNAEWYQVTHDLGNTVTFDAPTMLSKRSVTYTHHPLEAVAPFAAEVLK